VVSSAEEPGELERACARIFASGAGGGTQTASGGPAGAQDSGSATIELGGRPALMTWRPLTVAPWILVDARSLGSLQADLKRMRDYAVAVCVVLVAIGLAMSAAIAGGTTRALHRLEGAMRRAESGDLEARCEVGVGDEVAWLGTRFNSMLDEIGGLVGELHDTIGELEAKREALREEQTQKRRAELAALQAQINPHFLYNTLNTIIWMADREKVPQIAELAANLGTFFRISLSRGAERITLAEELEQVRSYLVVQKARHGDALSYEVELSPEIATTPVVKLIVQPLVENSIEHGIMEVGGRGRVKVTAARSEDGRSAVVRVDDDGVGMDGATLEETNARLAAGEGGGEAGYGIYNVNERLRLEYGSEWGLRYALLPGGGLRAELRFPIAGACS
jgi:two-component system sensor histidine kinase YesM